MLSCFQLSAAGLSGWVRDTKGNPVPGATVYISELRTGTVSNSEGYYQVSLAPGVYNLTFQAVGFEKRVLKVSIIEDHYEELNIELQEGLFHIPEVRVYSGGEDPAYAMMRKAISLAPYYLQQASSYESEVYLRGSFVLDKVPKILGKGVSVSVNSQEAQVGETYTYESLNRLQFIAPDTFHHTIVSSRSTFSGLDDNSPIGYINSSFYENDNDLFISPLSPQAMRHYKFRYEGYSMDGNRVINKIRVIPRRKSQQLLEGDLYLVEGLWCIHSVDFSLETFFGVVNMRQMYAPVSDGIWLPVSHNFRIVASIMGLKGKANYMSSVKYLEVVRNMKLSPPALIADKLAVEPAPAEEVSKPVSTKDQRRMQELMEKENLSNRDMIRLAALIEKDSQRQETKRKEVLEIKSTYMFKIENDSLYRDSGIWESIRPIPLTLDEKRSFAVKDSLLAVSKDSLASDSATTAKKFTKILSQILDGPTFPREGAYKFRYGGLTDLSALGFNAVDGWRYGQKVGFEWQQDTLHRLKADASVGYAFARKKWYGELTLQQDYQPLRRGLIKVSGGTGAYDFKGDMGLNYLINMGASLLFKENYWRLYHNDFLKVSNEVDIANGLRLTTDIAWHNMAPLGNSTNYSFFYRDKEYYDNVVENRGVVNQNFDAQKALVWSAGLEYTPRQYYRIANGRKQALHSAYPTLTARVEQGLEALGSTADYLLLEGGIYKKADFSFKPSFSWALDGGYYLRNRQMHFSQFKHFQSSSSPLIFNDFTDGLFLLDDYEASTNSWYMRAGATYSSPWMLIKNLPFFSNRVWNENLHINYLHTPENPHYFETGYSISRIFMVGSIGVFAGFSEGSYSHWGLKAAITLW